MGLFKNIKKIKSILPALIAVLLATVIFVLLYMFYVADDNDTLIKSKTIGDITEFDDKITVAQGETLVQLYNNVELDYQQLGFNVWAVSDAAKLKVEISDGSHTQTNTFKKSDIAAGYTYVDLDDELKASVHQLMLTFFVEDGKFEFYANKTVEISGSSCTLDKKELDKNAVIDLRTPMDNSNDIKFIVLTIASIVFLLLLITIIKLKILKTEGLVAFILAFFCIVCIFVFPPFTVPDEGTHYRSAYHISNMIMFDFDDSQGSLQMRNCDYEFFTRGRNSVHEQNYIKEDKFDVLFAKDTQVVDTSLEYMTKKFVPHFAPGLGLAVARIIGFGPYWAFQIARLFNAAMCIVLIYLAIKIIPYGKLAIAAIALLPMTLHIMASCSYDAFTFGGVIFIFAYILYLIYADKKIGWKQLLLLALMIIVVIPQKVVYIGIAALLLIIPKEKFEKPRLHFVFKCCLGILAVISVLALQLHNTTKLVSSTVEYSGEAGYSIPYILSNPSQIIKMLFKTILVQGDFYLKSLISYFGWFELEPPWFMAAPYVAVLVISFMRVKGEPASLGWLQKSYSLMMFAVSFLLIELLLLIDWTYMGSEIVLGVQGRYFIPALPALFLFVRNNSVELSEKFEKILLFVISLLNSGMFLYCLSTIA